MILRHERVARDALEARRTHAALWHRTAVHAVPDLPFPVVPTRGPVARGVVADAARHDFGRLGGAVGARRVAAFGARYDAEVDVSGTEGALRAAAAGALKQPWPPKKILRAADRDSNALPCRRSTWQGVLIETVDA